MEDQTLIDILEHHLVQAEQATDLYKIRMRRTIDRIKSGFYLQKEEDLIIDLQSLGFQDLARQVRSGLYV